MGMKDEHGKKVKGPIDFKGRVLYHTELDENTNRPRGYIISGTPGEPQVGGPSMYQYQGLAGKLVKGAKEGYDFIEIDLWADAELLEPHLADRIRQIKSGHSIDTGLHLRVDLDLTSAMAPIWEVNHKSLVTGAIGAVEIVGANFVLMHSAASPVIEFAEGAARTAPAMLLTPWKGNLAEFIQNPLKYDHEARKRFLEDDETPRHGWNIFKDESVPIEQMDEQQKKRCEDERYKNSPTLMDWALARFITTIWFPNVPPEASIVIGLKNVESMKGVRRNVNKAKSILRKYFENDDDSIFNRRYNQMEKQRHERYSPIEEYKRKEMESQQANSSQEKERIKKEMDSLSKKIEENNLEQEMNRYMKELRDYQPFMRIKSIYKEGYSFNDVFIRQFDDMIDLLKISSGDRHKIRENNKDKEIQSGLPLPYTDAEKKALKEDISVLDSIKYKGHLTIEQGRALRGIDFDKNYRHWIHKGAEGEEFIAYRTMAKWMYVTRDPLYEEIVMNDKEINDWWKGNKDSKIFNDMDDEFIYPMKGISDDSKKLETFLDPDNIIIYTNLSGEPLNLPIRKMQAAVAAKYIQGHFDQPMMPDHKIYLEKPADINDRFTDLSVRRQDQRMIDERGNRKSIYEYLYSNGVHFYIETQDAMNDQWRGKVRIMRLTDHISIIKAFKQHYGFDNVSYTMDLEHLTANLLNPEEQIDSIHDGDAKYISMMHINPPTGVQGLHRVLKRMSFDAEVIYKWLYKLRSKGMKDAYLVWERGKDEGSGTFEAPLALRSLAEELEKGTHPDELPQEFFGIDDNFMAMQHHAIKEHGLDPLRDMFFFKPNDHTYMGQIARQMNPEIADKEKKR